MCRDEGEPPVTGPCTEFISAAVRLLPTSEPRTAGRATPIGPRPPVQSPVQTYLRHSGPGAVALSMPSQSGSLFSGLPLPVAFSWRPFTEQPQREPAAGSTGGPQDAAGREHATPGPASRTHGALPEPRGLIPSGLLSLSVTNSCPAYGPRFLPLPSRRCTASRRRTVLGTAGTTYRKGRGCSEHPPG